MEHKKIKELIKDIVFGEIIEGNRLIVEEHLKECKECRTEFKELKNLQHLLDETKQPEVNDKLLSESRYALRGALLKENQRRSIKDALRSFSNNFFMSNYKLAISGVTVLLIGMFLGYLFFSPENDNPLKNPIVKTQDQFSLLKSDVRISDVKLIEQDPETGDIEFAFTAVKPVHIKGNINDPKIQSLVTYSMVNEQNPGIRLNTINLMKNIPSGYDDEIKTALITVVKYDSIPGVRREALKMLSKYNLDEKIKNAFLYVLMNDDNASLRIEAISSLSKAKKDKGVFNQEDVSVFKDKMQTDENDYVRFQAKTVYEEIK